MKTRVLAAAGLAAFAGLANAQSTTNATVGYNITWQDTGNNNGVVEQGESVLLHITAVMSPAVNTVIGFTGGQGGPTGTLRGVASGFIDLTGAGGTAGNFNLDPAAGYGVDPTWDL